MSSSYSLRQEPRRDEPELPRLDVEELVHHLDVEELLHHLDVEEFRHDELLRLDEQLPHDATNLDELFLLSSARAPTRRTRTAPPGRTAPP